MPESSSSSSSPSTAFHTITSLAMLPYKQRFIVSFVCCCCFSFAASQMCKKKRKKVEEKEGHFTVGERGWRSRGSKSCKSIRKLQQEHHWHRSRAISSRVDSHLCAESLSPHPGRRHEPTAASFLVASFIPRYYVITWPLRDRFQHISGSDDRNFLGSLEFSIHAWSKWFQTRNLLVQREVKSNVSKKTFKERVILSAKIVAKY